MHLFRTVGLPRYSEPDLCFSLDKRGQTTSTGWWTRYCARRTARMLWKSGSVTFQFGGYHGAFKKNYVLVDASVFQLMHWILRQSGYDCCPADVMRRCGANRKPAPDGVLDIFSEQ